MIFNAPSLSDHWWFIVCDDMKRLFLLVVALAEEQTERAPATSTQHNTTQHVFFLYYLFDCWMTDLLLPAHHRRRPTKLLWGNCCADGCYDRGYCPGSVDVVMWRCASSACRQLWMWRQTLKWSTLKNGGSRPHNVHFKKKRLYKCILTVFEYFSLHFMHLLSSISEALVTVS